MADDFGLKIGLEGEKEFKKALSEINQSFKVLGSEMKVVQSQFDKNDNSVEALTARNQVLNKEIEAQKQKIETLKQALANASESFGENDRRTQQWQIQLNNATAALNGMERELRENNDALDHAENGFDDAEKQADQFGDEVEDAGRQSDDAGGKFEKLGTVCKAAGVAIAAAFAAVSAAAVAAGKALVDMAVEGAAYADTVLTEATVTGIATDKLQEYMYAAELIDVSTETLTNSMARQIKSMKSVTDGSASMVSAYDALGVSVTDANGNLRDSDTVYWELIDALGQVNNETERDALAMTILGKSAQELNPLIEAGSQRMCELGEEAQNAGYVLSDEMLAAYGALDDNLQYERKNYGDSHVRGTGKGKEAFRTGTAPSAQVRGQKERSEKSAYKGGTLTMTNEELNTKVYEKLFDEQQKYKGWLLTQSPEEILNHAYEYTVREDIVLGMEYLDLRDEQAKALLSSHTNPK